MLVIPPGFWYNYRTRFSWGQASGMGDMDRSLAGIKSFGGGITNSAFFIGSVSESSPTVGSKSPQLDMSISELLMVTVRFTELGGYNLSPLPL